jgi:heme/copper-type cytochrome/quinol oxidase subunit 2
MDSTTLILIEAGLIFGGVIGFGVWQILSLRREKKRDAEKNGPAGRNRFRD